MIGTKIAERLLKKSVKSLGRVADEASEQRGSYYKVGRDRGNSQLSRKDTRSGNPNQLTQKENFNGFGCPE